MEDDGYWYTGEEAWDMGNEYARGYTVATSITNQWLSVSEYLDLYGTINQVKVIFMLLTNILSPL